MARHQLVFDASVLPARVQVGFGVWQFLKTCMLVTVIINIVVI